MRRNREMKALKFNRREAFLRALADTGIVTVAAGVAGVTRARAYQVRKEDPVFAAAWDEAEEKRPRTHLKLRLGGERLSACRNRSFAFIADRPVNLRLRHRRQAVKQPKARHLHQIIRVGVTCCPR
jgi:hypothetical protein